MFRIEVINEKEELLACQTFNNYGDMMQAYELIKNKYYNKFKNCTMQVFAGMNLENLTEEKDLEMNL